MALQLNGFTLKYQTNCLETVFRILATQKINEVTTVSISLLLSDPYSRVQPWRAAILQFLDAFLLQNT